MSKCWNQSAPLTPMRWLRLSEVWKASQLCERTRLLLTACGPTPGRGLRTRSEPALPPVPALRAPHLSPPRGPPVGKAGIMTTGGRCQVKGGPTLQPRQASQKQARGVAPCISFTGINRRIPMSTVEGFTKPIRHRYLERRFSIFNQFFFFLNENSLSRARDHSGRKSSPKTRLNWLQ